ncbi:MAG: radical SAM/Cys-rich protein [Planctomycetota bacterium]|jgi:radical SAM/Cys-rich protein
MNTNSIAIHDFDARLKQAELQPLAASGIEFMQINVGKLCNQTCEHCHVDAGPSRKEVMTQETAELCMHVLAETEIPTVDITGGAPEMCPSFEYLVRESRRLGRHVIDRCNLTILGLKRFAHLPEFFAEHQVEVICSLPDFDLENTDKQRGRGVYEASIAGLRKLNALGYGKEGSGLRLVLVTNPIGAVLPGPQACMEIEWKRELERLHGVSFDALYTITNMPISRFNDWLDSRGELEKYMSTLTNAFNPAAVPGVMCRTTLSVGWQGDLYDCDFNQMLDLPVGFDAPKHLRDFEMQSLSSRRIVTASHCFGCTAGGGSSCGGSTQ